MDTHAICASVELNFGFEVKRLRAAQGGLDAEARCFVATTDDGLQYFIKVRTRPSPGLLLSSALVARGIKNVVGPLTSLSGASWVEEGSFTLVAFPFIEGENGWSDVLKPPHWVTLGKTLKEIHSSPLSELPVKGLAQEQFQVEGSGRLFRNLAASARGTCCERAGCRSD